MDQSRDIGGAAGALLGYWEERYRALVDVAPHGVSEIDRRGRILFANAAYHRLVGYPDGALAGVDVFDLFADEAGRQHARGTLADLLEQQPAPQSYVSQLRALSGEVITARMDWTYSRDPAGHVIGFTSMVTDITQQRRVEELQAKLKDIADSVPGAVYQFSFDADGTIRPLFVSRGIKELHEVDPEAVMADPDLATRMIVAGDLERGFAGLASAARDLIPLRQEYRIRRSDGLRWVQIHAVPTRQDDGTVLWNALLMDVTERKQAEARVRFQASLLDAVEQAVIAVDLEDRILYWNRFAEKLYGWTAEEAMGRRGQDILVSPEMAERTREIGEILRRGESWSGEFPVQRRDGSTFSAHVIDSPIHDEAGRLIGIIGVSVDVTAQNRTEAALRQAQKMEAVGQLTGGVAHDFNNLLMVILGNAEVLLDGLSAGPARAQAELIVRAAEHGADLTQRLLAFSRQQTLQPTALDLNEVVLGVERLLRRTLGEQIEIRIEAASDLPRVMADRTQLEAALLNLAVNARDAMPEGGRLAIRTAAVDLPAAGPADWADVPPGKYLLLDLADTGVGMSPEVAARAFEPFFTTKEVGKGTGLGLSQVYGFAKQSGGHAHIASEPGRGTVVALTLPAAGNSVAALTPETPQPTQGVGTVLVVEDEPGVRRLVVEQLRRFGYRVVEAAEGQGALDALDREPGIDLLFTDVVLPGGLSGRQLAEEARRRRPGLPVLFTSGYPEEVFGRDGGLPAGTRLLRKPYHRRDMAGAVRAALGLADGDT